MFNVETRTDETENDGVWAEFKGSSFLIASSGSTKFQRMFAKLQLPHRKALEKKKLDPEIQLDIMARSMAKTMILDWNNVIDGKGNDIKFDSDVAYAALKGNSEFREFITEYSTELENYIEEEKTELGKSVETSSTGKSSSDQEKVS